jgi:hypothetical protein
MITEVDWSDVGTVRGVSKEADLFVLTPRANSIHITHRYGGCYVTARHDGADEGGDIETLKTLCLIRFNQGEQS